MIKSADHLEYIKAFISANYTLLWIQDSQYSDMGTETEKVISACSSFQLKKKTSLGLDIKTVEAQYYYWSIRLCHIYCLSSIIIIDFTLISIMRMLLYNPRGKGLHTFLILFQKSTFKSIKHILYEQMQFVVINAHWLNIVICYL